jgi:hypothetical protein
MLHEEIGTWLRPALLCLRLDGTCAHARGSSQTLFHTISPAHDAVKSQITLAQVSCTPSSLLSRQLLAKLPARHEDLDSSGVHATDCQAH